jgi:hypothetical protein
MARILWDSFHVPLEIWNKTVKILGYPYHECINSDVESQFHITREELFPAESLMNNPAFINNGKLTEAGLSELRKNASYRPY